jgi:hypothetical protein
MREIYTAHRPQKLADVVGLLLEWRDEEEELLALVTQKYMGVLRLDRRSCWRELCRLRQIRAWLIKTTTKLEPVW